MNAPEPSPPSANLLDGVRKLADAILYEGYLLYPYRASAQKNRQRFQFGVLMPPGYADPSESSALRLECVLEGREDTQLSVLIRFLQLQLRQGTRAAPWDEAVERELRFTLPLPDLLDGERIHAFHCDGGEDFEQTPETVIRIQHVRWDLDGELRARVTRLPGPYGALQLRLDVANTTDTHGTVDRRDDALRRALISAHVVVQVSGGAFVSMVDPPRWAAEYVAQCENVGVWPVLAGPADRRDLLLGSPIILYDHAEVAPESPGALFDSTEIDEILTLRTLALTDAEKSEARATDPRAAAVIDRVEGLSPELMDRLHGAIRYLEAATGTRPEPDPYNIPAHDALDLPDELTVPWWNPEADSSVSPETDQILIGGIAVSRGSAVLMKPGARRADAQDLFLAGRPALVEAVLKDVDGNVHLAVSPQDDPDADLRGQHGRFLYFAPDEVEPICPTEPVRPTEPFEVTS